MGAKFTLCTGAFPQVKKSRSAFLTLHYYAVTQWHQERKKKNVERFLLSFSGRILEELESSFLSCFHPVNSEEDLSNNFFSEFLDVPY